MEFKEKMRKTGKKIKFDKKKFTKNDNSMKKNNKIWKII